MDFGNLEYDSSKAANAFNSDDLLYSCCKGCDTCRCGDTGAGQPFTDEQCAGSAIYNPASADVVYGGDIGESKRT